MDLQPERSATPPTIRTTPIRTAGRWLLGAALGNAGIAHLTYARAEFQAQVPPWIPRDPDLVVLLSGVVELGLAVALLAAPRALRTWIGWVTAAFFVAIFPGNISQFLTRTDAFGLNSDTARLVRLFFQPLLVVWALWATAAWTTWRAAVRGGGASPIPEALGDIQGDPVREG